MTFLQYRNLSVCLRLGLFASVSAPIVLVFLGSSMVDVQASASVDQPLASVKGPVGVALASLLLALTALNCEESSAGVIVAFVWSIVVEVAQFFGVARLPSLMKSSMGTEDVIVGVSWCLYPACMSLMLGICVLTIKSVRARAGKSMRVPLAHVYRHGSDTTVVLPATVAADTLVVMAAPSGTTNIAIMGLEGVTENFEPMHQLVLGAGIAFAALVVNAHWSIMSTQITSWFTLVLPTYVVLPVQASSMGNVIVPGPSLLTEMALANPSLTVLRMVTGCASMGVLWIRVRVLRKLETDDDSTAKEGPAEG